MRLAIIAAVTACLCGCGIIYKLPTRQGNVLDQDDLDKLELGMTREQVRFVMGTPMAASSLQPDRWDYLGYYKNPRGKTFSRKVSLYFEADKLARMDGVKEEDPGQPDLESVEAEDAKVRAEEKRKDDKSDAGIVITPGRN